MKTYKTTIGEHGFEGVLYTGDAPASQVMIVNLTFGGGSPMVKGLAKWLIGEKTDALGLTIQGTKATGKDQSQIPLEYISSAIIYLKEKGYERIGIMGLSLGASMALTAAAKMQELSLVMTMSAFDRVFEGVLGTGTQYPSGHSSFTWQGEDVPYQPFHLTKDEYIQLMKDAKKAHGEMYGRDLWENALKVEANEDALIPVEDIKGRIVMFGAETDTCWDTAGAAKRICARVKTDIVTYTYPHATHFILPECVPMINVMSRVAFNEYKTHKSECQAARRDVQDVMERELRSWSGSN